MSKDHLAAPGGQVVLAPTPSRLMREGLAHRHMGMKDHDFFALIDATGGWPLGYQYVGFEHTDSRAAGFCNSQQNTGWWTVLFSADDYYLWKLSPAALQRIADAVRGSIRLTVVDASKLQIRNSRGYTAALAAALPSPTKEPA